MMIYYCDVCKKVIGESQQGKTGVLKIKMECYNCVRCCFTKKEMLEKFTKEELSNVEYILAHEGVKDGKN